MTQLRIPAVHMRGGTSKGVFLLAHDLPSDQEARDRILLRVIGSPDHGKAASRNDRHGCLGPRRRGGDPRHLSIGLHRSQQARHGFGHPSDILSLGAEAICREG